LLLAFAFAFGVSERSSLLLPDRFKCSGIPVITLIAQSDMAEIGRVAEGRSMQRKLVLWFVLLIVGFLAGFILQYARLEQAQQELSA